MTNQQNYKVALVGNPNCGKTTIFNLLTGANQKVGNWTGVTVDKKTGTFFHKDHGFDVVDLPGLYSLSSSDSTSLDEKIASDYILNEKPDAVINIVDASNMERNLFMTMQLLEMKVPVILAVNMIDVAKNKGIVVHFDKLQKQLGVPVVPVIGRKNVGMDALKDKILAESESHPAPFNVFKHYPSEPLNQIINVLKNSQDAPSVPYKWLATRLLEDDGFAKSLISESLFNEINALFAPHKAGDYEVKISSARYQMIYEILNECCDKTQVRRHRVTEILDSVCMNRYLGLPVFLVVMYLMFEFAITIGGNIMPIFDGLSNVIFVQGLTHLMEQLYFPGWIISIVAQGIGLGINTVLSFIPQIFCMFLFLSFLEDSGYMARAAFVMDRFMQAIGLPGKSFVPLIVGFGCNVPAIMATRTLETRRDRLMTIMMSPFISCGARLAIFAVFASAFFPGGNGAFVVFLLYVLGIAGAIITGFIVKWTILGGQNTPFVMEIPVYHLPKMKSLVIHSWNRLKRFLKRAGKLIIPLCMVLGVLNTFTWQGQLVEQGSDNTLMAETGQFITPVLEPMGVTQDNWPASVGLITGTLAKEVVIGTMNSLYGQQAKHQNASQKPSQHTFNFWHKVKQNFVNVYHSFADVDWRKFINPFAANKAGAKMDSTAMGTMHSAFGSKAAAFAYMLFVLLYIPCVSTIGAMNRETGKNWAWLSVIWSLSLAYCSAVIVYQAFQIAYTPVSAISYITAALTTLGVIIAGMRYFADRIEFKPKVSSKCGSCK